MAPRNPERIFFILHRVTGLILLVYFVLHAVSMGSLLGGLGCCTGLATAIVSSSAVRFTVAVVAVFHGLNGVRLLLAEALALGLGKPGIPRPPYVSPSLRGGQRLLLYLVAAASLLGIVAAAMAVGWV